MRLYNPSPDDGGSAAGESLAQAAQKQNSIQVPAEYLQGCKVGDTYKVTAMDNDNVTLEHAGEPSDDEWTAGANKAAAMNEEGV